MKRVLRMVDTYEMDDDYIVEIIETEEGFEAWLGRSEIIFKTFMYGAPKLRDDGTPNTDREEFEEMIFETWQDHVDNFKFTGNAYEDAFNNKWFKEGE